MLFNALLDKVLRQENELVSPQKNGLLILDVTSLTNKIYDIKVTEPENSDDGKVPWETELT